MKNLVAMKELRAGAIAVVVACGMLAAPILASASTRPYQDKPLPEKVRHELVMLPYFTIFDNLSYQVDGRTVTLSGQVRDPVLKSDAGRVVQRIEGVENVVNNIQALPLSPFDNHICFATARAIYGYAPLQRYSLGARPSIHIIVDNGRVTLLGVVANQMDKSMAYLRANGVSGVFSVTNDLQVEQTPRS